MRGGAGRWYMDSEALLKESEITLRKKNLLCLSVYGESAFFFFNRY